MPHGITARPTTDFARENIFNVIENLIDLEGKKALDLFAGTGAISFELLSRGCSSVTAVETASPQLHFLKSVKEKLEDKNLHIKRADCFKYITKADESFDFIFADPPYDHPRFGEIPTMILESRLVESGTLFVMEHSKKYDFSTLPNFLEHREYGSVNFSIFKIK